MMKRSRMVINLPWVHSIRYRIFRSYQVTEVEEGFAVLIMEFKSVVHLVVIRRMLEGRSKKPAHNNKKMNLSVLYFETNDFILCIT